MFCAYCGAPLASDDAAFCSRCGASVADAATGDQLIPVGSKNLPLAGGWQRVGGFAVDAVLLYFIAAVPMLVALYATGAFDYLDDPACLAASSRFDSACQPDVTGIIAWAWVPYPIAFVYWWVSNSVGASIGKLVSGARVVRRDGRRPGAARGLLRTAVSVISAWTFGLGYLWAFWDSRRQTWHDKAAGTYVVRVRS